MERYKRTKSDSVLKCPYCGRQFNVGIKHANKAFKTCKGCGKTFYYINYSKAYCTKTGKRATYTLEEIRGKEVYKMTLTDCTFAYKENAKVKEYVDKFAKCHRMTVEDTLKQAIVQNYIEDEVKKECQI